MSLIWKVPSTPLNILHAQDSPEWYTPSPYVEAARTVMGSIDLDPASHAEANEIVKATLFYTEQDNGLELPWGGNVFINPPGKGELVCLFWRKLVWQLPTIHQFVWIGYSLEQLQTLQICSPGITPLDFMVCYPRKRIPFVENEAKKAARIAKLLKEGKTPNKKSSPSHANYIAYGGDQRDNTKFRYVFEQFGQVVG